MLFFIGCEKMFSSEKIKEYITAETDLFNITAFEEIESTNTFLKNNCSAKKEWSVVVASSQTGGKGRLGRSFYSPKESGVYFSVLLKPALKLEEAVLITAAAAVAVTKALRTLGCENAQIKWVNDVFVNGKKVCGILTESVINPNTRLLDFAVLGVGINLLAPEGGFPSEIEEVAGAVFEKAEPLLKERFIAEFLNEFYVIYKDLSAKKFMEEYKEKCFFIGKEVTVISGKDMRKGRVLSVDDNARLEVEFSANCKEFISSGEISVKI